MLTLGTGIMMSMGLRDQRHSGRYPIAARKTAAAAFRSRTTEFQDRPGEHACVSHDTRWLAMAEENLCKAMEV